MDSDCCYLSEVFSGIQGEGPLVGVRQIFIRFSGCDLRCVWCDTPDSLTRQDDCEIEKINGTRSFEKVKNPISIDDLITYVHRLEPKVHHSISLTGGEPLLHHKFLSLFLPIIKKHIKLPVYLETGGHRVEELQSVINYVDYVSMDFKLPSSSGMGVLWDRHEKFLTQTLLSQKSIWVKIVVTSNTSFSELEYSVKLVKSVSGNNKVEVFLQPVSVMNGVQPPDEISLLAIQSKLIKIYPYIKVLPQVHKLIGQK